MKKHYVTAFMSLFLFAPVFCQYDTTLNDFDIAKKFISQPANKLTSIIEGLEFETYITRSNETKIHFYLLRGDISIRTFILEIGNLYKGTGSSKKVITENVCIQVYVRYNHENSNDLRDFFSYEVPTSNKFVEYEKNLGVEKSRLKIMLKDR